MICAFTPRPDRAARIMRRSVAWASRSLTLRRLAAGLIVVALCAEPICQARADELARANAAYARGDYIGAVKSLTPLALRGHAGAQAFLGFMYENGYGAPQAYDAATDL